VGEPRKRTGKSLSNNEKRSSGVNAYVTTIESPAGPLTFATDERGALVWLQFVDGEYEHTVEQELEREGFSVEQDEDITTGARAQLQEYYAGTRQKFDVPFVLTGSEWQKVVWQALTRIPFGETRSYAEVAAMVGRPKAARAVGRANATNRLPVVVPCHRVIGTDGSLTGFAGGTHLKTRLLEHEARALTGSGPIPAGRS
jgi:methylated-DNA-[protein]-cysteine S-methyltransferase